MEFKDTIYKKENGIAKVTINRPEVYNAFRYQTVKEMAFAFEDAALDASVGVIVLTGAGDKAFCVGHDNKEAKEGGDDLARERVFMHTKFQRLIRENPKPVIAAVNGWSIGGGNVFCVLCDLAIASETAKFGQAGPKMGSFAAGWGASLLARTVGEKKAREIWFLCRHYTAKEALDMGLINKVVPPDKLEEEVNIWCQEILRLSPTSLRFIKVALNADTDHIFGLDQLAVAGLELYRKTEEAAEWSQAFAQKRSPDWHSFRTTKKSEKRAKRKSPK